MFPAREIQLLGRPQNSRSKVPMSSGQDRMPRVEILSLLPRNCAYRKNTTLKKRKQSNTNTIITMASRKYKFTCQYCLKGIMSKSGLTRHVKSKPSCLAAQKAAAGMVAASQPTPGVPLAAQHPSHQARVSFGASDSIKLISPRDKSKKRSAEAADLDETTEMGRVGLRKLDRSGKDSSQHAFGGQKTDKTAGNTTSPASPCDYLRRYDFKSGEGEVEVDNEEDAGPKLGSLGRNTHLLAEKPDFHGQRSPFDNEDFGHFEGAEEVEKFMASDNYRLRDPQRQQPVPEHILNPDYNHDNEINIEPNTMMRDGFRAYCVRGKKHFMDMKKVEARSVKLLSTLKKKRAPLDTYDEIMDWHHREAGNINSRQQLKDLGDEHKSRDAMLKFLTDRYNMEAKQPTEINIRLPHSKARVKLTRHDAWDCIESLLTDPRITDDDYNFPNNDPFWVPQYPRRIGELHTGLAYYRAHQKYITKPNQILFPILLYIDGAITGQMQNLPITTLKMSPGILTMKTRDKSLAWRNMGNVAVVGKASSHGSDLYAATGHMDAEDPDLTDDEDYPIDPEHSTTEKSQDFHAMLACLLESYKDVQKNGFIWDFRYRGKTYWDTEFVPFIMFIKCDTLEGDLLCGSYTSRMEGVSQLCRYCCCPTGETDLVKVNYPEKTVEMISLCRETNDLQRLKGLSQQNIKNAFHDIRFGPHTTQGVHGACPSEMLHAVLLGMFKYCRECLFEQIGPDSQLAKDINGLAQKFGEAFGRQSDRDIPKCQFKRGIQKGKLMAKEYRGILLVIAALLRSEKGRELLGTNKNFETPTQIKDWTVLIELMLQWEAYLNRYEMHMKHVFKLDKKHRYLMYVMKSVADRAAGMGLKLTKFHILVHMWKDIRAYGIPLEHDTGSCESLHKDTKAAARLTQKNETTFDYQTTVRLDEFLLIDLAVDELYTKRAMWRYYERPETEPPPPPPPPRPPATGGKNINVFLHDSGPGPFYSMGKGKEAKIPAKEKSWDSCVIRFLWHLQSKLSIKNMSILTQHTRNGDIFRGTPEVYGKRHWRDWAMFDWGGQDGVLPGHIWCFVVIHDLPDVGDRELRHGGIDLEVGTFAVIESATWLDEENEIVQSEIFVPIRKEVKVKQNATRGWKRQFYLADVEAIQRPCCVIPNIGGGDGVEFFVVKNRGEWANMFESWLNDPNENDIIGPNEPTPGHG